MKRLEGGFINRVFLDDGVVVKIFDNDTLVGVPSVQRIRNESRALRLFGGTIAPRLISQEGIMLRQEFIEGESYDSMARRGKNVFRIAGATLAKIHEVKFCCCLFPGGYIHRFETALNRARPILELEGVLPIFDLSWQIASEFGLTYIHGDYWLGNVLGTGSGDPRVIDWEFSGAGSPYEDFAIVDLWIFREFEGSEESFWQGYGRKPDPSVVNSFLILRCVEFLATTNLNNYTVEEDNGFYHNKVRVLRSLLV